jgi:hypothetical protein
MSGKLRQIPAKESHSQHRKCAAIQLSQLTQQLPDLQALPFRQLLLARISLQDSRIFEPTISRRR